MSIKRRISVNGARNFKTFLDYRNQGWDYIINPGTGELHSLKVSDYVGCHNLKLAKLERFCPVVDIGETRIIDMKDGEEIEVFDINTGRLTGTYLLNKCRYCF